MSDPPSIVPYEPGHREGLRRLWSSYFGDWSADRLERRWSWQFEANPWVAERPPRILVALAGARVVGHISGVPLPLRTGAETVIPLFASGLVVEESERWLGFRLVRALLGEPPVVATAMSEAAGTLFTKCGAALVERSRLQYVLPRSYAGHLAARLRARLPASLASAVRVPAIRAAAGWYVPKGRPRRESLPGAVRGFDVRPVEVFDAEYDRLWLEVGARYGFTLVKSARYMNWRYVECPVSRPVRLALHEGGSLTGVAVGIVRADVDAHRRPCARYGEITEFVARDPASPGARALLGSLVRALDARGVDAVTSLPLSADARPALEALGLAARPHDAFAIAVKLPGSPARTVEAAGSTSWSCGAGDGDSLYSSGV